MPSPDTMLSSLLSMLHDSIFKLPTQRPQSTLSSIDLDRLMPHCMSFSGFWNQSACSTCEIFQQQSRSTHECSPYKTDVKRLMPCRFLYQAILLQIKLQLWETLKASSLCWGKKWQTCAQPPRLTFVLTSILPANATDCIVVPKLLAQGNRELSTSAQVSSSQIALPDRPSQRSMEFCLGTGLSNMGLLVKDCRETLFASGGCWGRLSAIGCCCSWACHVFDKTKGPMSLQCKPMKEGSWPLGQKRLSTEREKTEFSHGSNMSWASVLKQKGLFKQELLQERADPEPQCDKYCEIDSNA